MQPQISGASQTTLSGSGLSQQDKCWAGASLSGCLCEHSTALPPPPTWAILKPSLIEPSVDRVPSAGPVTQSHTGQDTGPHSCASAVPSTLKANGLKGPGAVASQPAVHLPQACTRFLPAPQIRGAAPQGEGRGGTEGQVCPREAGAQAPTPTWERSGGLGARGHATSTPAHTQRSRATCLSTRPLQRTGTWLILS